MTTKLSYLDNTYLFVGHGEVSSLGRNEKGGFVVFDETIFYPQGGGQPADVGMLVAGDIQIPVTFVGFQNGEVLHHIPDPFWQGIIVGQTFEHHIDSKRRIIDARLHTGGHLISHIFESMQASLIPIKGYHFHEGSYVEFLNSEGIDVTGLLDEANSLVHDAISSNKAVESSYSGFDSIQTLRPHLAPFVPQDKPSRLVAIDGYLPLPCGGTHIGHLMELGSLRVTKVKRAKENLRVSYELLDG